MAQHLAGEGQVLLFNLKVPSFMLLKPCRLDRTCYFIEVHPNAQSHSLKINVTLAEKNELATKFL